MEKFDNCITKKEYCHQKIYEDKILDINNKYFEKSNKRKKFFIGTFGCQMNVRDSENLTGMMINMGFENVASEKEADVVIYNTCCVRENAENRVFGNLGILKNAKKHNPNLKIILCGCMMQQDLIIQKIKQTYRHVDVIFGTYNIHKMPQLLYTNFECNETIIDIWDNHADIIEDLPSKREKKYKASVNIMYGCDNFCTYCIVPYVRGRERSRELEDILNEISDLAKDGVKEILLLGQNVNSYGKNLKNKITFSELLRKIHEINGILRIKFLTSHPKDLSDDLIQTMKDCKKICNHLHLPIQSGSNKILKKMGRLYTKENYIDLIDRLKYQIKDICITTDIIVGFPGETQEDFEETLDLVEKVRFSSSYTFIYSKRQGTPAAKLKSDLDVQIVKTRFELLNQKLNSITYDINSKQVGNIFEILVENLDFHTHVATGRTTNNFIVHFGFDEHKNLEEGDTINVKIIDFKTFYLVGKISN